MKSLATPVIQRDPILSPDNNLDQWSVGVLTFVLLSGYSPFLSDDDNLTMSNVISWVIWLSIFSETHFFLSGTNITSILRSLMKFPPKRKISSPGCWDRRVRGGYQVRERLDKARCGEWTELNIITASDCLQHNWLKEKLIRKKTNKIKVKPKTQSAWQVLTSILFLGF